MKIPKSFIVAAFLWPIVLLLFWEGYEKTLATVVPARFHEHVMPWQLYVYPWGFKGPYRRQGPYITADRCRDKGLDTLSDYMARWPDITFTGARFTCSQRCEYAIEGTDVRVCAQVRQFNIQGNHVQDTGI